MPHIGHACLAHERVGAHEAGHKGPQNQDGGRVAARNKKILKVFDPSPRVPADRQITEQTDDNAELKAIHPAIDSQAVFGLSHSAPGSNMP